MKDYTSESIRNVGTGSHGGAGKTSLVEAMLYTMGATTRLGHVEQGNTISDYNEDEIERQISISTSLLHGDWDKHKINIIDTPGFFDFFGDVISGLSCVENVLILISASSGIEVGSEQIWNLAEKYNKPATFVLNKLDLPGTRQAAEAFQRAAADIEPIWISALKGRGIEDLLSQIVQRLGKAYEG